MQALAAFSISTPSAAFLVYGGYVYFDRMGRVKGVSLSSIFDGDCLGVEAGNDGNDKYQETQGVPKRQNFRYFHWDDPQCHDHHTKLQSFDVERLRAWV